MSAKTCPVTRTVTELKHTIDAGRLQNPRSRRIAEEILQLLNDIAWGLAGDRHIPAITSLADELAYDEADAAAMETAAFLHDAVDHNREVFVSHIETHNCSTGDCVKLAPA